MAETEQVLASGGRLVSPSVFAGFGQVLADGLMAGLRRQVAAGWVNHYRPQTAREVIDEGLEFSRSEDLDTPEGWFFGERFGEQCPDRWG